MKSKVTFLGTLTGPVCGELLCNLGFLRYLKESRNDIKVNELSTYIGDGELASPGSFSIRKIMQALRISLKAIPMVLACDSLYITPGLSRFGLYRFLPFFILSSLMGKKLIIHYHGSLLPETYSEFSAIEKKIFRYYIKNAECNVFLTNKLKSKAESVIGLSNAVVVPNGLDEEVFNFFYGKREYHNKNGARDWKCVFLSNLIPEKGIYESIEAIQDLQKDGVSISLDIIGSGSRKIVNDIEKMICGNDSIAYLGPKYGADKLEKLLESDFFLLPSYYKQEAFPISILEAMAAGSVVISTEAGGISEVVENGVTGVLVPPRSSLEIQKSLYNLIVDIPRYKAMSENSIESSRQYSFISTCRDLASLL